MTREPLRVAIVGAGPAGCLMAAALVRLARLRRREAQILLLGARSAWGPDRPLVLDDASVAALTALGIPLPSGHRVDGILTAHGRRAANLPTSLHVLPRNRVVGLFRALLHAQGVGLVDGTASGIAAMPRGGFVVRVDGASYTVDAVVLCCGAGAPVATRIAGHAPPPALRAMGARFALASPLPPAIHRHPQSSGDLWILPERDGASTILVSSDAGARTFGLRLLELGLEHPPLALGAPEQVYGFWVPAGAARPALPCLGNALGGPPGGPSLGAVADQADRLAAALLDDGIEEATQLARTEARSLQRTLRSARRVDRRLRRFPVAVRERALRPPRSGRLPTPAQRALRGEPLGLGSALLAFVLLVWIWLQVVLSRGRAPVVPEARDASRPVYVVDDDPAQAEGICAHMRERGLACRAFPDAMRAVQAARHEPPAALVLDLALPWIDGKEALRALRRSWLAETPVLVTSALPVGQSVVREGLAQGWLEKPIDLEELDRRIDAFLGRGARRPPDDARATGEPISWG